MPTPTLRRSLHRFGLTGFRPGQEAVIRSILDRRHTLAIMPTGAGKSLCYQLPGLHLEGTTIVVSPLISLMKDQVDKLRELGVAVEQVNSSVPAAEASDSKARIEGRRSEFVFTTPEQLANPDVLAMLRRNRIDVFVIDEAHCISEWGHDFRPAYLGLRDAIAALGTPPVLALTATATDAVAEDIQRQLGLGELEIIETALFRPNLQYAVVPVADEEDRRHRLLTLLRETDGKGIVYASTVRQCQELAPALQAAGIEAGIYHGRLAAKRRKDEQDRFMSGGMKTIVATNAFGLGIDKPDIRFVIHYTMPGSIESYYQESGRAGRDGDPARCVLLFHPHDRRTHAYFLGGKYPRFEAIQAVYDALQGAGAADGPVAAGALSARGVAVSRTKLQVVLAHLRDIGITERTDDDRLRLVRAGLTRDELGAIAAEYEQRGRTDREKLDRMVSYAQSALCRWRLLLEYFGDDELERCATCDNCGKATARAAEREAPAPNESGPGTRRRTG